MSKIIQSNLCPVCLEHYSEVRFPNVLKCGHTLCSQCTTRLTSCPIDRQTFDQDEIIRLYNSTEEKTAREKVADLASVLTEQIEKIEKLEEENDKLKDDKKKLVATVERKTKCIDDVKAKLRKYEKIS